MMHQAYLTAVYMLGTRYHSGQWSRGYQLACIAQERMNREHSCADVGRMAEHLDGHTLYSRGSPFRNAVACCLRRLRHCRHAL